MHSERRFNRSSARQRGSTLLLVLAAFFLSMLLGLTYMEIVRQDRLATRNLAGAGDVDMVLDSVLDMVSNKLNADLGMQSVAMANRPDRPFLENRGDGTDTFDYPHDDIDAWLASSAPQDDTNGDLVWEHITDLTGQYANEPRANTSGMRRTALFAQAIRWNDGNAATSRTGNVEVTYNLSDEGVIADADGDGIADSKWAVAPVPVLRGRQYYMAVRIVDLSSMMNINVATPASWYDMTSKAAVAGRLTAGAMNINKSRGYFPTMADVNRLLSFKADPSTGSRINWFNEVGFFQLDDGTNPVLPEETVSRLIEYRGLIRPGATPGSVQLPVDIGIFDRQNPDQTPIAGSATDAWFNRALLYYESQGKYGIDTELEFRHRNGLNRGRNDAEAEDSMPQVTGRGDEAKSFYQYYPPFFPPSNPPSSATPTGPMQPEVRQYLLGRTAPDAPTLRQRLRVTGFRSLRHSLTTVSGSVPWATPFELNATSPYKLDLKVGTPSVSLIDAEKEATPLRVYNRVLSILNLPVSLATYYAGLNTPQDREAAAEQFAAALQDYSDTDNTPSMVNVSSDGVASYGLERLPFLREVYLQAGYEHENLAEEPVELWSANRTFRTGTQAIAVELGNPNALPVTLGPGFTEASVRLVAKSAATGDVLLQDWSLGTTTTVTLSGRIDGDAESDTVVVYSNPATPLIEGGTDRADLISDLAIPASQPRVDASSAHFPFGSSEAITVELQVFPAGASGWVTYDRMTINEPTLFPDVAPGASTASGPDNRHQQATFVRDGQYARFISNEGAALVDRRDATDDTATYRDDVDKFDVEAKGVGNSIPQGFQMAVPNRPIYSTAELGVMLTFGFSDTQTVSEQLAAAGADYVTLNWDEQVASSTKLSHAAMILDQFIPFAPFADGRDNDNSDGDGNPLTLNEVDAFERELGEHLLPGTININTAPLHVLASAIPANMNNGTGHFDRTEDLARRIIRYRDYDQTNNKVETDRRPIGWDPNWRNGVGIQVLGELMGITHRGAQFTATGGDDIRNPNDINGTNNLYPMPEDGGTDPFNGVPSNGPETDLARFQFISDIFSTRSDFFVAYITIRGYEPSNLEADAARSQVRAIAIFDRSNIVKSGDRPRILGVMKF